MYTVYDEKEEKFVKVEEPSPLYGYTYADYLQWKFEERLELLRGKIFQLAAPNTQHQIISLKLSNAFYTYLKGQVCRVFAAPFDVRLPAQNCKKDNEITTVVQPDLCVVCDPKKIDDRGVCGAPELMIEILSPGNNRKELKYKFELYEEAGVREYWVVYPSVQNVTVFLLNKEGKFDAAQFYADGDRLAATAVPGFSIDVTEIFTP